MRSYASRKIEQNVMVRAAKTVTKPVFHPLDTLNHLTSPLLHPVQTIFAVTEFFSASPPMDVDRNLRD